MEGGSCQEILPSQDFDAFCQRIKEALTSDSSYHKVCPPKVKGPYFFGGSLVKAWG